MATVSVDSSQTAVFRTWPTRLAFGAFLLSRLFALSFFAPIGSDYGVYIDYAVRGVDGGEVPYRDISIEYPAAAWWAIALPRYLSSTSHDRDTQYVSWFRREMAVFDAAAFALFATLVRRRRPEVLTPALWGYVLATTLLMPVLYDRLDAGLLLVLMLWAWLWTHGEDQGNGNQAWLHLSLAAVGFGIAYKLVPVVMVPFLLLGAWRMRGRWTDMALAGATVAVSAALPFLWQARSAGWGVLGFLKYHAERPLEIESIYATLLMCLAPFGLSIHGSPSFGCWNLDSSLSPGLAAASTWILAAALAGLAGWAWRQGPRYRLLAAYHAAILSVVLAVTLSKALSTQYFLWVIPLLLLLGSEVLPSRRFVLLTVLLISMAGLTTWIFPYHFFEADPGDPEIVYSRWALIRSGDAPPRNLHPIACAVLVARNSLLIGVVCWCGRDILRKQSP